MMPVSIILTRKNSYVLSIKSKRDVFRTLYEISPFLRVKQKKERAIFILNNYDDVTPRNGNNPRLQKQKIEFENNFFKI